VRRPITSRPLIVTVVIMTLSACGGVSLAASLRSSEQQVAAPVFQRFELPGEIAPKSTPTPTAKPKKKKSRKKKMALATAKPTVVPSTPKPAPVATPKPAPVVTPKPASFSAPKPTSGGANNTALLIGLDKAPGSDPLQGMVQDTKTMKTMLLRAGYKEENITVLTNSKATKGAILHELDRLAARTSGKGLAVVSISSHSGVSGGDMTFATGGGGRVSRAELAARLKKVRGKLWTTISTCYSGAYDTPGITGSNRIAVFTAAKDELSYQNAAGSVTIVYMIQRGMIEHGIRSIEDAYQFAKSEMTKAGASSKVPILRDGIAGDTVPGALH
jgi:hypothetical protein